jgi:hypothetical protein
MEKVEALLGVGSLNHLVHRLEDGFERRPDSGFIIDQEHALFGLTAVF